MKYRESVDELEPSQTAELRDALQVRREELEAVLDSSADGAKPVDLSEPIGRLSRLDAIQQQKMTVANREGQAAELRRITVALAALDSGDYGYCRHCEESIRFERLRARPDAQICIACQSKLESR